MTVDEAKRKTKTKSDPELAAFFGVTRAAIVNWRAAGYVPIRRQHEIELRKRGRKVAL